jgi:hypothetical protein
MAACIAINAAQISREVVMAIKVRIKAEKAAPVVERPEFVLARFLNRNNEVPKPPNPAWCILVNGAVESVYTLGQERALIEHYFQKGAGE